MYAALNLYEQLKRKNDEAICLLNIGYTNNLQGNNSEAIKKKAPKRRNIVFFIDQRNKELSSTS